MARQTRPELYRPCAARPAPLVPAELRFAARERTRRARCLRRSTRRRSAARSTGSRDAEVESVAVCLLHSYARPEHERRVAQAVAERLPGVHVSASHDLLAVFREYERTSTTVIDAYLSPLLGGYLDRLCGRAADGGPARRRRSCARAAGCIAGGGGAATPPGPCCPARRPGRSAPRTPARCPAATASSRSTWAAPRATSP